MRRSQLPTYALALAVLVVGLAAVGVPVSTLAFVPIFVACPLMMMFMMRGMGHGGGKGDEPELGERSKPSERIEREPDSATDLTSR